MRSALLAGLVAAALWRLSVWSADRDRATALCARLAVPAGPVLLSISGTLRRRADGGGALLDARDGSGQGFAGAVQLAPELAARVPETGQEVTVTGPFRCLSGARNPSRVADGLLRLEPVRLFASSLRTRVVATGRSAALRVRAAEGFAAAISAPFTAYPGLRGWVRAVWLGDTAALPPELVVFYREGGLLPMLALSGQHVVVLTGLVGWSLRRLFGILFRSRFLRRLQPVYRETLRALPLAVALVLYVVSQESPSMLRTAAMAAAFYLLRLRRLECPPLQLATSAVACALVWSPETAARPGFFLSAACTAFLLRLVAEEGMRGLLRGYAVLGLAMTTLALPLSAFFFGKVSGAAPLLQLLLGWLWEWVLMPVGFLLPFLAVLGGGALGSLETAWDRLVALHGAGDRWIAPLYVPAPVPTWLELVLVESGLLALFVLSLRCLRPRRPLLFPG